MAFANPNYRFIGWAFSADPNVLYDEELIKRDLMNEFETPRGSLDYDPDFGSIIEELVMDIQTPDTQRLIQGELERILTKDIRIEILQLNVITLPRRYTVDCSIRFGNVKEVAFKLEFDRQTGSSIGE